MELNLMKKPIYGITVTLKDGTIKTFDTYQHNEEIIMKRFKENNIEIVDMKRELIGHSI